MEEVVLSNGSKVTKRKVKVRDLANAEADQAAAERNAGEEKAAAAKTSMLAVPAATIRLGIGRRGRCSWRDVLIGHWLSPGVGACAVHPATPHRWSAIASGPLFTCKVL